MLELPSTKMLLSQQAKLINLNSDSAEIGISGKWINMIQTRKKLIEDAFLKARGFQTKVILVQQKDNFSKGTEEIKINDQQEDKNKYKINSEINKKNLENPKKIYPQNNLDNNSIDKKAKQLADFFNGEIINLE